MHTASYKIVGHRLCPYVQRVVITMNEHAIPFEREDVDLDDLPIWLEDLSPNRQVPVFCAGADDWLFESGAIARYLDRAVDGELLPHDGLSAARHEAWMAYVDGMLTLVAKIIYRDEDADEVDRSMSTLRDRLKRMEDRFPPAPYFAGETFGLVDIVAATLFRYFPVLDMVSAVKIGPDLGARLGAWWGKVRDRPSVVAAVPDTYEAELIRFIAEKQSHAARTLASMQMVPLVETPAS